MGAQQQLGCIKPTPGPTFPRLNSHFFPDIPGVPILSGVANDAPRKAYVSIAVLTLLVGCSSTPRHSAPQPFTVSNDAVAQVVRDAVAGDRWAAPIEGSPLVNCTGQARCTISYTVQEATSTIFHKEHAADMQLISPTAPMWKALFNDPQFLSGTLTVRGPVTTAEGKAETAIYFTLTCDRAAASKIDWDNVDGHGIRTQCDYKAQTEGLPGYTGPARTGT